MNPIRSTYILPVLSGILLATACPRFHIGFLAWVALVPLIVGVWTRSSKHTAWHFFIAGWVFHSITLQWLVSNIFWAGGWAVLGQQGLCILLSTFWALGGWVWCKTTQHHPGIVRAPVLALIWVAIEFGHSVAFTGFGWTALGYTQGPVLHVAQLAALGGVSLISLFILLVNGLLATAWICKPCRRNAIIAALAVFGAALGIGALSYDEHEYGDEPFQVGIVQTNFGQLMKWDRNHLVPMVEEAADLSRALTQRPGSVDLFVWPEAALMGDYNYGPLLRPVHALTTETGTPLITGTVRRGDGPEESYNSAIVVDAAGDVVAHYDKVHLAPFGEYLPLEPLTSFLRFILVRDVTHGEEQKVLPVADKNFGPLICFEVLFTPMAMGLRRQGADSLVVMANLGWFGASNAVPQALEVARFRAIESRLPLIQAANTGISGVFGPYGQFVAVGQERLPDLQPNDLVMRKASGLLPLPEKAPHPFPAGPVWVPRILSLLALLAVLLSNIKPKKARKDG